MRHYVKAIERCTVSSDGLEERLIELYWEWDGRASSTMYGHAFNVLAFIHSFAAAATAAAAAVIVVVIVVVEFQCLPYIEDIMLT